MKKVIKSLLLILAAGALFSTFSTVMAEEIQMENEAGIGFENDYIPSSSTDEPGIPSGTTEPSQTPDPPPAGGKKYFPPTGEVVQKSSLIGGIVLLILTGGVMLYSRKRRKAN